MRPAYEPAVAPFTADHRLVAALVLYALADRVGRLDPEGVADLAAALTAAALVDLGLLTADEVEALPDVGADLVVEALVRAMDLRATQRAGEADPDDG